MSTFSPLTSLIISSLKNAVSALSNRVLLFHNFLMLSIAIDLAELCSSWCFCCLSFISLQFSKLAQSAFIHKIFPNKLFISLTFIGISSHNFFRISFKSSLVTLLEFSKVYNESFIYFFRDVNLRSLLLFVFQILLKTLSAHCESSHNQYEVKSFCSSDIFIQSFVSLWVVTLSLFVK